MAVEIRMPQLGLTMTEGTVTAWHKQEGDSVVQGELLLEVETDKLTNEIESDAAGILRKIAAPAGSEVPVKGLLAVIGAADEEIQIPDSAPTPAEPPVAGPALASREPLRAASPETPAGRIKASPLARRLAVERGIELSSLAGSGPGGRIVKRDVVAAAITQPRPSGTERRPVAGDGPGVRRDRMSAMRRAIAKNMAHSWQTAPAVTYNCSADVTALAELKRTVEQSGQKVSYTDLMAKLVSRALLEHPLLNAALDGEDLLLHEHVNLGIAVGLEDGLVVPVVRDAHAKGLGALSREIKVLAAKAREGALSPDDMQGGTFTVTNLGMYGVDSFSPIINQPQSAILGLGAIKRVPVEAETGVAFQSRMGLSLTADHRVVDGAVAARFLARICALMAQPWQLLL